MKSFISALAATVIFFTGTAIGQEVKSGIIPSSEEQPPSFKTFYTLSNGYRNDISFVGDPTGAMKGHFKITGSSCFIDRIVSVEKRGSKFFVFSEKSDPHTSGNTSACDGMKTSVSFFKGTFGYVGTVEYKTHDGLNFPGTFSFR